MTITYCIECAAPLTKETDTKYTCPNGHFYWNNPHAAATIIVLHGNQFLASERGIEPNKGKYDFPGGFIEYGEEPVAAVRRELQEETGLTLEAEPVLLSCSVQPYQEGTSVVDLIYVTHNWSGEPKPQDDVSNLAWKPISFIDSDQFAWRYPGLTEKLRAFVKQ